MVLNIITEQLANKLPEDSKLLKYNIINPVNFNQLYQLLTFNKISEICVTDSTATDNIEFGTIIPVKDHVNRTGTNILIGKQQFLRIDFIDMTNQYITKQNSIITGMHKIKWIASFMMVAATSKLRGKLIFLMIDALPVNVLEASLTELANHCQGNIPVSKYSV